MAGDDDQDSGGKFLGLGLQMMMGVLLGVLIGWWLDRRYGWSPWGTLIGSMLGLAGGMYLLIKETMTGNGRK